MFNSNIPFGRESLPLSPTAKSRRFPPPLRARAAPAMPPAKDSALAPVKEPAASGFGSPDFAKAAKCGSPKNAASSFRIPDRCYPALGVSQGLISSTRQPTERKDYDTHGKRPAAILRHRTLVQARPCAYGAVHGRSVATSAAPFPFPPFGPLRHK
jgi:hypothetical protein